MTVSPSSVRLATITPLMKQAVQLIPHSFVYLYPFPYQLHINEHNILVIEKQSDFQKSLPWFISAFLVTGVVTFTCCAYTIFSYTFEYRINSTVNIGLISVMVSVGGVVFEVTELVTHVSFLMFPQLVWDFNKINEIELHCMIC